MFAMTERVPWSGSVTFAEISIAERLYTELFEGVAFVMMGPPRSLIVTLPASIVTLYNCGLKSPSSVIKLNLYWKYLLALVGNSVCFAVLLVMSTNDSPTQDESSQERVVTLRRTAPRR